MYNEWDRNTFLAIKPLMFRLYLRESLLIQFTYLSLFKIEERVHLQMGLEWFFGFWTNGNEYEIAKNAVSSKLLMWERTGIPKAKFVNNLN